MKQNIEAAIAMRPITVQVPKKTLAMTIARLFAGLASRNRARHSEWSNGQSGLHERDQSAFCRRLSEAKLRETYRCIR